MASGNGLRMAMGTRPSESAGWQFRGLPNEPCRHNLCRGLCRNLRIPMTPHSAFAKKGAEAANKPPCANFGGSVTSESWHTWQKQSHQGWGTVARVFISCSRKDKNLALQLGKAR